MVIHHLKTSSDTYWEHICTPENILVTITSMDTLWANLLPGYCSGCRGWCCHFGCIWWSYGSCSAFAAEETAGGWFGRTIGMILLSYNGIPSGSLTARPWKMMVGRLFSFWDGIFSVAMLNFQGVIQGKGCIFRCYVSFWEYLSVVFLPWWWEVPKGSRVVVCPFQMAMNMASFMAYKWRWS